jgi:hypothetical protein
MLKWMFLRLDFDLKGSGEQNADSLSGERERESTPFREFYSAELDAQMRP